MSEKGRRLKSSFTLVVMVRTRLRVNNSVVMRPSGVELVYLESSSKVGCGPPRTAGKHLRLRRQYVTAVRANSRLSSRLLSLSLSSVRGVNLKCCCFVDFCGGDRSFREL